MKLSYAKSLCVGAQSPGRLLFQSKNVDFAQGTGLLQSVAVSFIRNQKKNNCEVEILQGKVGHK